MAAWEPEVPSGSEGDSVPSPRGTGWWLGASWTAAALAKEAEVQGGAPAGTGAGLTVHVVRKPGRSLGLGYEAQHRSSGARGSWEKEEVRREARVHLQRSRLGREQGHGSQDPVRQR